MIAYLIGTYTAGKLNDLIDGFLRIAKIHGPFVAFAVIIVFVQILLMVWLIKQTITSRDQEIERLVKERDKLQTVILKNRLSTQNK